MADVVGPRGAGRVGLAGEGVALRGRLRGPLPVEARGSVRAEVAPARADGLDDHQVERRALAIERVDLDGLEKVVPGAVHDDGCLGAKVAGEVADGHAGPVDAPVVAREEEIHVRAVGDERLVDRAGVRVGDAAGKQRLRRGPAVGVDGVGRGPVGKGGCAPLVGQHPDALGSEVEERRRDRGKVHLVLRCRGHVGPVAEEAKVHGAIGGAAIVGAVD